MKRKTAREIIRIEFATHGKGTAKAMRAFIEGGISFESYNLQRRKGLKIYNNSKKQ